MNNREMWKWARRVILAELIFLLIAITIFNTRYSEASPSPSNVSPGGSFPTYEPYQRKAFYAAGRFWAFYRESSDTYISFKSSTDGATWSSGTAFANVPAAYAFSLYYDGSKLLLVYYPANQTQIYYKQGTPGGSGTITWETTRLVKTNASTGEIFSYGTVTRDTNGYPWIASMRQDGGTALQSVRAYQASATDGSGAWTEHTVESAAVHISFPSIIPVSTGRIMVVYDKVNVAQWDLRYRGWNGAAWDAAGTISSEGPALYNQYSLTVSGDNIHLIYVNTTNYLKYKTWQYGGSASTVTVAAVAASTHATISATSLNDLTVFYEKNDAKLYYVQRISGVWGSPAAFGDQTGVRNGSPTAYLNEYSGFTGLLWSRTDTGYVRFDYLIGLSSTTTTVSGSTTTFSGFDLPTVPDAIGDALGIGSEAGGLLLSFILLFMILVPLGMLTKSFWVLLIVGFTLAGFLTAIQWLPVWIMVMLSLITALMLGSRLTGIVSRGGSEEGD